MKKSMKKLLVLAVFASCCAGLFPLAAHAQGYYPNPMMQQPQTQQSYPSPYYAPYPQYQQPYPSYQQPYQQPYQSYYPSGQPCAPTYNYASCAQPQMIPQCGQFRGSAEQLYRCGLSLVYARRYAEAIGTFQQFLSYYPQSDLADNALYWTGEAYYAQKQYGQALSFFQQILTRYPRGNKVPDAMLKIALSYFSLNRNSEGCQCLHELLARYPNSEPAQKAYRWLNRCGYPSGGYSGGYPSGGGSGYVQPYSDTIPQPWYSESSLPKYW